MAESASAIAPIGSAATASARPLPQVLRQGCERLGGRLPLVERLRLLPDRHLRLDRGGRLLLGRARHLLCPALGLRGGAFGLQRRSQRVLAACGHALHVRAHHIQAPDDLHASLRLDRRPVRRPSDRLDHLPHLGLDRLGQALHVLGALLRRLRQGAHLFGNHREAEPVVAGARRLDRGVERQQVGLVGNPADEAGDVPDLARPPLQLRHDGDGRLLTARIPLDRADGRRNLHRGLGEHRSR
ncbi:MAG: hypothetical protein WDN49_07845 [Acetobacteraceae bacterium]